MLAHLEARLADVVGSRLAPPFGGRVFVLPGPPGDAAPTLFVAVTHADVIEPDLGSRRFEVVPGVEVPRRVARMRCTIEIAARAGTGQGRPQQLAALDAVLYELGDEALRTGTALRQPGDPGFLLESLAARSLQMEGEGVDRPRVVAEAVGWFWPPGVEGEEGEPIDTALVRWAQLPVSLEGWPSRVQAGDPAVPLVVRVGVTGTMELDASGVSTAPFGAMALRLIDAGGRPGAGQLTGGAAGPDGARILTVVDGSVSFTYNPPPQGAHDQLVVSIARADAGAGVTIGAELARFALEVRE